MRNGGKSRFKRTKIDELMNYMVYTVSGSLCLSVQIGSAALFFSITLSFPRCRSSPCCCWRRPVWPSVTASGTRTSEPRPGTCSTARTGAPPTGASSASGATSSSSTPWCPSRYTSGQCPRFLVFPLHDMFSDS